MPACSTGWFWHALAHETGRLAHLFSPGDQRGPWPWFRPHGDNGNFKLWTPETNAFDFAGWETRKVYAFRNLLFWAQVAASRGCPFGWQIVPDVPGNAEVTLAWWKIYAPEVLTAGIPLALAVQNGMEPSHIRALDPAPDVVCVGGDTTWKWATAEMWCREFPRVHVLRCNSPAKLTLLESWGCESTDGTGWSRGDRTQTEGLERWARRNVEPEHGWLFPHVCRGERKAARQLPGQPQQEAFA